MTATSSARVLVVGVPRSGTTWVARVLAQAAGARYLEEPDNHFRFAYAYKAKTDLGRCEYPLLRPGERGDETRSLATLWQRAFCAAPADRLSLVRRHTGDRLIQAAGPSRVSAALATGARDPLALAAARRLAVPHSIAPADGAVVVKTVYGPLAAEWVADVCALDSVLVVFRNPFNVVSSWLSLGWLDSAGREPVAALAPAARDELSARFGPPPHSRVGRAAWLVGVMSCVLDDTARRLGWQRVVHEELCADPVAAFQEVATRLGLGWSQRGDDLLAADNRAGSGYELTRVAVELPDAWRSRLGDEEVDEITRAVERLPLPGTR